MIKKIFLVGNPNVGKTTLFNTLSGKTEETGNYSGTTLSSTETEVFFPSEEKVLLVDVPGMYGSKVPKEEEKVAWKIIENAMGEEGSVFVQVVDPDIAEQSLSLALELKKRGIPLVLFLNEKKRIARKKLKKNIEEHLCVGVLIGNAEDKTLQKYFWRELQRATEEKKIQVCSLNEFELIEKVLPKKKPKDTEITWQEKVDSFFLHPFFGIAIFAGMMWLMFQMVFTLGAIPMNWIDALFSAVINGGKELFGTSLLSLLVFDGLVAGVGATVIFLPNIILLFLGLSLMKESGYLARSSYLLNGFFRRMGLSGRVSVPLLMGFGCNVPSVMAVSTLESRKEKIAVAMMSLFMSCGARLPVYTLLIGAFLPLQWRGITLFCIYLFGIFVAFGTGEIIGKWYPEKSLPLLLQLPKYHRPSLKKICSFSWRQGVHFFERVWKFIVPASILLWMLFSFPISALETGGVEASYGARMAKTIQPIFAPLGFDWTITAGVFAGVSAKEVMVSSFAQIYEQDNDEMLGKYLQTLPQFSLPTVFALLVFTLLYMPCIAVIATIKAQLGTQWALIGAVYPTVLAWIFGFLVYTVSSLFFS